MDGINDIHWHDCELESIVEIPAQDMLALNVQYPEDWEREVYAPRSIVFDGYVSQQVDEIPFLGNRTLLNATVLSEVPTRCQVDGYFLVKIETNAGDRFVVAKSVSLRSAHVHI